MTSTTLIVLGGRDGSSFLNNMCTITAFIVNTFGFATKHRKLRIVLLIIGIVFSICSFIATRDDLLLGFIKIAIVWTIPYAIGSFIQNKRSGRDNSQHN